MKQCIREKRQRIIKMELISYTFESHHEKTCHLGVLTVRHKPFCSAAGVSCSLLAICGNRNLIYSTIIAVKYEDTVQTTRMCTEIDRLIGHSFPMLRFTLCNVSFFFYI